MEPKKNKGFAAMHPGRQREIAGWGGLVAHRKGTAHEWDSSEAQAAGRKGGLKRAANDRLRKQTEARHDAWLAVHDPWTSCRTCGFQMGTKFGDLCPKCGHVSSEVAAGC